MKDIAHHMKKLNRQVIRSERRMEMKDEAHARNLPSSPPWSNRPKSQLRKQAKAKMRKSREEHISSDLTPEQKNRKMKHRVPIFDRTSHSKPRLLGAKPPRKQRSI
jgi:hypothetical protein